MIAANRHITLNKTSKTLGLTSSLLFAVMINMKAIASADSGRIAPT